MLYLFACISEKCINRSDTFRAYRCIIKDDNPHITFATDEDYNEILNKTDDTLMTTKYYQYYPEETEKEIDTEKEFILQEYLVFTEEEGKEDTALYLSHSQRLNGKKMTEEQNDQAKEQLEQAFLMHNFGVQNKANEKQAEKLLKAYQLAEAAEKEEQPEDGKEIDEELEAKHLEEFINQHHTNYATISEDFKLFEVVTAANPAQVLRYSQQQKSVVDPLWTGDRYKPTSVPACEMCQTPRVFEF